MRVGLVTATVHAGKWEVRRELAVLLELLRADDADRLPLLPVLGPAALLLVDGAVAVDGDGEVRLGELLVERLLRGALVPAQVAPPGASVGELVAKVLVVLVPAREDDRVGTVDGLAGDSCYRRPEEKG